MDACATTGLLGFLPPTWFAAMLESVDWHFSCCFLNLSSWPCKDISYQIKCAKPHKQQLHLRKNCFQLNHSVFWKHNHINEIVIALGKGNRNPKNYERRWFQILQCCENVAMDYATWYGMIEGGTNREGFCSLFLRNRIQHALITYNTPNCQLQVIKRASLYGEYLP